MKTYIGVTSCPLLTVFKKVWSCGGMAKPGMTPWPTVWFLCQYYTYLSKPKQKFMQVCCGCGLIPQFPLEALKQSVQSHTFCPKIMKHCTHMWSLRTREQPGSILRRKLAILVESCLFVNKSAMCKSRIPCTGQNGYARAVHGFL